MSVPAPIHHVFIDFENVREIDLSLIGCPNFQFVLLLGAQQTKLNVDVVVKLLEHAGSVQMIRLTAMGKNALDFALVYYAGRAVAAAPKDHFHIISKDTGYDPLLLHLRSTHVRIRRHEDFASLQLLASGRESPAPVQNQEVAVPKPKPAAKKVVQVIAAKKTPAKTPAVKKALPINALEKSLVYLRKKKAENRPKNEKALMNELASHLQKQAGSAEMHELIRKLAEAGHLSMNDKKKVDYHLEAA
ncbi:PIN domain-containing protein [Prosthecobacter sp. SYSU 5D2]|uniref:PIN domain-containing protein n=1 Tax=Prosthecobacter sp. SYSU 5D2 TaxID=3134134 RepID=UPI0031FE8EA6